MVLMVMVVVKVIVIIFIVAMTTDLTCMDPNSEFKMVPWSVANSKSLNNNSLSLSRFYPCDHHSEIH